MKTSFVLKRYFQKSDISFVKSQNLLKSSQKWLFYGFQNIVVIYFFFKI